jgi:Helix-turn-helix domain
MSEPERVRGASPDREPPRSKAEALAEALGHTIRRDPPDELPDAQVDAGHRFDQVSRTARADRRLGDRAYRLLAAIESYCWGDRRDCWTCNRILGEQIGGSSPSTVRRAIRELVTAGYLRVEPDATKMRGQRLILLFELARSEPYE